MCPARNIAVQSIPIDARVLMDFLAIESYDD